MKGYWWLLLPLAALCLIVIAYIVSGSMRPRNRVMQVAYLAGDIYLPSLRPQQWDEGTKQRCILASPAAPTLNNLNDLLLCGNLAEQAWGIVWLRDDVRKSVYANAIPHQVNFHTFGHDRGRYRSKWWACEKTSGPLLPKLECY